MSDLLGSQGIFYPQNFARLGRKVSFSTPTPVDNNYGCWLARFLIALGAEFLTTDQKAAEPEKSDAKPIEAKQ